MLTDPTIKMRATQPYAAKVIEVALPEIPAKAPPLIEEVMDWVKAHEGSVAGPPFFNYFEFLPGGRMKMAIGVPTGAIMLGGEDVVTGALPAGRYASTICTGPYGDLHGANMALDDWARREGFTYAGDRPGQPPVGATRLEIYSDPGSDTAPPVTEVAFLLND